MKYIEVINRLRELGDKNVRKSQRNQGAPEGRHLGVTNAKLKKLAKELDRDWKLGEQLWTSKYIEAQILATLLVDGKEMDKKDLNRWAYEVDYWLVAEQFGVNVALKSKIRGGRMRKWLDSDHQNVKLVGLNMLKNWPLREKYIDEDELAGYVKMISKDFKRSEERVKQAMLFALIAIGKRSPGLHEQALKTGKKLGRVKLRLTKDDSDDSSSGTPDILEELTDGRVTARWETMVP